MSKVKWKIAQFLELKWWQYYLLNKSKDDYLQWKREYWYSFIKNYLLPHDDIHNKALKILDAGCGPAGIFIVLPQHHIDALDPLINRYEALPHFSKADYPNINFICTSLENFNSVEQYDVVFCFNAINHVDDLTKAINTLTACAAKQSVIFISIDVHKFALIENILQWLPFDALHPQQYSLSEYAALFQSKKLLVKEVKTINKGIIFDYVLFTLIPQT